MLNNIGHCDINVWRRHYSVAWTVVVLWCRSNSTAAVVTAVSAMAVAAAATGDAIEVWAASAAVALLAMAETQGSTDRGLCCNGVAVQIKATAATDRMGC